ncbi:polynucleotide adenylyltransferase PcnB [OM182 bacterium]|nr:polynucleotide adenylyltransferase PcnB [OM182 bacterium]
MSEPQNKKTLSEAVIVPRDQHIVTRRNISDAALRVLRGLNAAGYDSYLVGGGVRDLLLGRQPKDFDIATDATPEQIKKVFKNSRIIGRRFKIVHVRFGREIFEVTTFRGPHNNRNVVGDKGQQNIKGLESAQSNNGLILRDNVYGRIDEDAERRDFTINSLYYTLKDFVILDFTGGIEDIQKKTIRIIGNPTERYIEDPVRMLRALRFSAKLNFKIETNTLEPIDKLAHLLGSISTARLFDESIKLLATGHGRKSFKNLKQYKIGMYLFEPTLSAMETDFTKNQQSSRLLDLALHNTDLRLEEGKSVTPGFLFAALLWPVFQMYLEINKKLKLTKKQLFQSSIDMAIERQLSYTAIPKRFTIAIKEIWRLQSQLERASPRNIGIVFSNKKFRAAYDFLLLREQSGEKLKSITSWWTLFQLSDEQAQSQMIASKKPLHGMKKTT